MPWLSIIIPVYNPPLHLFERCLKSSIKIVGVPLEIILVDDGSNSETKNFCRKQVDKRIRYICQDNQGVSKAREVGIENAKGKYIYFLDADDAIPEEWGKFIEKNYLKIKADWVLFDVIDYFPEESVCKRRNIFENEKETFGKHVALEYMLNSSVLNECWGKLIRRDFLVEHSIGFPIGVVQGEDKIFNYRVIQYTEKIEAYNTVGYIYRVELKNTERLLQNPVKYFENLKNIYETEMETVNLCAKNIDHEQQIKKVKIIRINEVASAVVKLISAGHWKSSSKVFVSDWLDETKLLKQIQCRHIKNYKIKVYYILLKYEFWMGFRVLSIFKTI